MSTFKLKEMDPTPDKAPTFSKKPFRRKLVEMAGTIWTNTTVEPLMAVIGLTDMINAVAVGDLNLEKACRMNLQYGDMICTAIMNGELPRDLKKNSWLRPPIKRINPKSRHLIGHRSKCLAIHDLSGKLISCEPGH